MSQPGFTGAGLDRADHLRLDPARIDGLRAHDGAQLLQLADLDPVLDAEGCLAWGRLDGGESELLFLGFDGEIPLFAPLVRSQSFGQRAWSVLRLVSLMSARDAAIWGTARSVNEWHNRHGFCGICGGETAVFRGGWGRTCRQCNAEHFPRVDPVVIMLAEHEGRVLLGRQPQYPPGRYSALAGFVEPGESIEEAVARELMEEAGIAVDNVRYVASQPWPFPGSLMIACTADSASDELRLDPAELEDGFWATRDEVGAALAGEPGARFQAPPPFAIANTLLTRWSAGG